MLFYVVANGFFLFAGCMLLWEKYNQQRGRTIGGLKEEVRSWTASIDTLKPQEVMVAKDTQVLPSTSTSICSSIDDVHPPIL